VDAYTWKQLNLILSVETEYIHISTSRPVDEAEKKHRQNWTSEINTKNVYVQAGSTAVLGPLDEQTDGTQEAWLSAGRSAAMLWAHNGQHFTTDALKRVLYTVQCNRKLRNKQTIIKEAIKQACYFRASFNSFTGGACASPLEKMPHLYSKLVHQTFYLTFVVFSFSIYQERWVQ